MHALSGNGRRLYCDGRSCAPQGSLAEALRDLDAGVEALAAEHRQCQKAAPFAAVRIRRTTADNARQPPTSAQTPSSSIDIGAPDSPVMRELARQAISEYAAAFGANGKAAPPPGKKAAPSAGPVSGRLDFMTVCAEAPELTQHPLIAAEEASADHVPWGHLNRGRALPQCCRG